MRYGISRIWPFLSPPLLTFRSKSPSFVTCMIAVASGVASLPLSWQSIVYFQMIGRVTLLKHKLDQNHQWLLISYREKASVPIVSYKVLCAPAPLSSLSYSVHPSCVLEGHTSFIAVLQEIQKRLHLWTFQWSFPLLGVIFPHTSVWLTPLTLSSFAQTSHYQQDLIWLFNENLNWLLTPFPTLSCLPFPPRALTTFQHTSPFTHKDLSSVSRT